MGFSKTAPSSSSRMGRLTNRGKEADADADGNKARSKFFHKRLDSSSRVIREKEQFYTEYVDEFGSSDEDENVPLQERIDGIIKNFHERYGSGQQTTGRDYPGGGGQWKLLVAGEQKLTKKKKLTRDLEEIDLKNDKSQTEVDKEAWILVARGDMKELPLDHLEDIEGLRWYPLAQGGDLYHESRGSNFKKLACWGVEKADDDKPWDEENMPIQTGDFVHFGHQESIFRTIRREPHQNWMRIKAGRSEFSAYSINNVPNDLYDMGVYMKNIMEQSIEDENIANKKREEAKLKQKPKQKPRPKKKK